MVTVLAGLSTGAIYALVACALNMIYITTATFNFAQPQFLMAGTFIAYFVVVTNQLPIVVALIVGAAIGGAIGLLENILAIIPARGAGDHGTLITTVGWAVAMQGAAIVIWGTSPLRVPGLGADHILSVAGGRLSVNDLTLIILAVALAVSLHFWLHGTRWGIASLAASDDRDAARIRGVNTSRLAMVAFGAGGALLGCLGTVVAPKTFAVFSLGTVLVVEAFVAMVIGGFGSIVGATIGSFLLGLIQAEVSLHLGTAYTSFAVLAVLVIVLTLRPQGLFGKRMERVV